MGHYASSMLHPRPFYYLENFCTALAWLRQRYGDLLNETEHAFIGSFHELPRESAALLVRMIGRKGDLFRTSKLGYSEIGCPSDAAMALIGLGWVDRHPILTLAELGRLLRKSELQRAFNIAGAAGFARKSQLLTYQATGSAAPQALAAWWPDAPDVIYRVVVKPLCDRLRLLFFGNFEQDWSQFVLADLGIFKYEKVPCDAATRAFHTREHINIFHALFLCRQQLEESDDIEGLLRTLPSSVADNEWLEDRRRKLQFRIAQRCERQGDFIRALQIYRECGYAGARVRVVRLLERLERTTDALQLAARIREQPADEAETQQVSRMWPRLQRKAGLIPQRSRPPHGWPTFKLVLPLAARPACLEEATAQALSQPGTPVHYVENGLINSLFGLLCWEAIFAPIAGAFFHEFQAAPADLHAAAFHGRRLAQFARCFRQLDGDEYRHTIGRHFEQKTGIQSPFVFWGVVSQVLLSRALDCLPREHLKVCFGRILANIRANACGLPDLVQFWPAERRYRLIEVKGPGDRLQDNQVRWLSFCVANGIPVSVCQVSW
ncbi:MAG: nuclease [Gammaproteobacteria bacterium]|nr:nuclease [Gammaproteobacteria bacterium]